MKILLKKFSDLEIWRDGNRYYAVYDAGTHQVTMRRDDLTEDEAKLACTDDESAIRMLFALQKRLVEQGQDPYVSNLQRTGRGKGS